MCDQKVGVTKPIFSTCTHCPFNFAASSAQKILVTPLACIQELLGHVNGNGAGTRGIICPDVHGLMVYWTQVLEVE